MRKITLKIKRTTQQHQHTTNINRQQTGEGRPTTRITNGHRYNLRNEAHISRRVIGS